MSERERLAESDNERQMNGSAGDLGCLEIASRLRGWNARGYGEDGTAWQDGDRIR